MVNQLVLIWHFSTKALKELYAAFTHSYIHCFLSDIHTRSYSNQQISIIPKDAYSFTGGHAAGIKPLTFN